MPADGRVVTKEEFYAKLIGEKRDVVTDCRKVGAHYVTTLTYRNGQPFGSIETNFTVYPCRKEYTLGG